MSVKTTADEMLDNARKAVLDAIDNLFPIVTGDVWGHDEFTEEFSDDIDAAFTTLLAVKKQLRG